MYLVEKDGMRFELRDNVQLAAFLNSGWNEVKATASPVKEEIPTPEVVKPAIKSVGRGRRK